MNTAYDLTRRFKNWRRWLFLRDWLPPRYMTILGRLYRPPQCWNLPEIRIPIDHLDAGRIEDAVHQLPEKHLKIIVLHHLGQIATGERVIRRVRRGEKWRIMGISERTFYRNLAESKIMLKNILDTWQ